MISPGPGAKESPSMLAVAPSELDGTVATNSQLTVLRAQGVVGRC